MVFWAIKEFGGEIPRQSPRNLPDQMGEQVWNTDLAAGPLNGLPTPMLVKDLSASPGPVMKAYRLPGPNAADPDAWLPLPSAFSSVVRSPLANDTEHRIYWTNPPDTSEPGGHWNTYAGIIAGTPAFSMGFNVPDPAITLTVTATGGTTTIPAIARSYTFTYIDSFNQESSPCVPSPTVDGPPDATWTVSGLPTTAPVPPAGKNYPTVTKMRLYRTVTGTSTAAQFFRVADIPFGSSSYVDTVPDTTVVNDVTMESTSWAPPVDDLDGLVTMPGGMLVGFSNNTVHFCEPNRPNAWPAAYDQATQHDIVGLGVWQQSLMVMTQGFPSTGSGVNPANFSMNTIQVPEPCIARGSIITDLMGVYYASQNGLVMLNYYGMQNQTLSSLTKNIWLKEYHADKIIACRHRAQYLAINGTGTGFIIDYTEPRMGIMHISPALDATAIWNDDYTGDSYLIAHKKVYLWDSPDTGPLIYRWRSKQFYLPAPASLGAVQISLEPAVAIPPPPYVDPPNQWTGDPGLYLPDGVNARFRLFAGPDGTHLVHEQFLDQPRMLFRVPGGFKAFNWQVEITACVAVHSIELASTFKELKGV